MPKPIGEYVNSFYGRLQRYNTQQLTAFKEYFDAKSQEGSQQSKQAAAQLSRFFASLLQNGMFQPGFENSLSNPAASHRVETALSDLGKSMSGDTNGTGTDVMDSFHTFLNEGGYDELKEENSAISQMYPLVNTLADIHFSLTPTAHAAMQSAQFAPLYEADLNARIEIENKAVSILSFTGKDIFAQQDLKKLKDAADQDDAAAKEAEQEYGWLIKEGQQHYRKEYLDYQRRIDEETEQLGILNRAYSEAREMIRSSRKQLEELEEIEKEFTSVVKRQNDALAKFRDAKNVMDEVDAEVNEFNRTYRELNDYMDYNHIGTEHKAGDLSKKSKREAERSYFECCVEELKWKNLDEKLGQIEAMVNGPLGGTIPSVLMSRDREKNSLMKVYTPEMQNTVRSAWKVYDEIKTIIPDEIGELEKNPEKKTVAQLYEDLKKTIHGRYEEARKTLENMPVHKKVTELKRLKEDIENTAKAKPQNEQEELAKSKLMQEYTILQAEKMNELAKENPQAFSTYDKAVMYHEKSLKRAQLLEKKRKARENFDRIKAQGQGIAKEYDSIVEKALKKADGEFALARKSYKNKKISEEQYQEIKKKHMDNFRAEHLTKCKDKVKEEMRILQDSVVKKPEAE